MYYVYVVIIWHPWLGRLYYVGKSHDPWVPGVNYYGSCKLRYYKSWVKKFVTKIRIVYKSNDPCEQAEVESLLIRKALTKKGAYLYGTTTSSGKPRDWLKPFGKGTCLNGHWSSESGRSGLTSESYKKMSETNLASELHASHMAALVAASHSEQACARRHQTKMALGQYTSWQQASCTESAVKKQSETRRSNATKFRVEFADGSIYVGCQQAVFDYVSEKYNTDWKAALYQRCCAGPWYVRKGLLRGSIITKL